MEASEIRRFSCDQCGKSYRWKPELAGRKVKCACEHVIVCPSDEDLYDLAPKEAPAPPAAAVPVALPYRSATHDPGPVDQHFPNRTIDLHAPLWLIGCSVVIRVAGALWMSRIPEASVSVALFRVGAEMIIGTIVMLAGVLAAAKFRGIQLGSFWVAILKLSAVSIAPSAVTTLLTPMLGFIPFGGLILWAIGFATYFALLGTFFDLDESDTWYCVMVIFVINVAIYFIFFALIKPA
jgi:hypothetical protein